MQKLAGDLQGSLAQCGIAVSSNAERPFHEAIYTKFIDAVINHIQERLPDSDCFSAFSVLDPSKLPGSAADAAVARYGEVKVELLSKQYGIGDHPFIRADEVQNEWIHLRVYLYECCLDKTMEEVLKLFASNPTLAMCYPIFQQTCPSVPCSAHKHSRLRTCFLYNAPCQESTQI